MKPAADPSHKGNSSEHHTGKPCVVMGCAAPAGTWWGKHWCQQHNAERLDRISATLDSMARKAELSKLVDEATESWRATCGDLLRERDALVLAAGGSATVTKAQLEFKPNGTGCQSHRDGSKTFRVY